MDSNRTPDLSKLSRLSRPPLKSNTGAPDLSKLSILSRNSNASDTDKLARLGERTSNFGRHQPQVKDSPSPSPFSQHAGATRMYVHYTLSEDRSGSVDEVMAQRLKALSCREKEVEESPWLQCLWAGCRDSWHRDQSSISLHIDRHVESARNHLCCRWQGCAKKELPFPDRYLLGDHVVVHTGQTSHTCIHCKVIFDHVEDHDTHLRVVHGDRRNVIDDETNARVSIRKLLLDENGPEEDALDLRVLIISDSPADQEVLHRMLNLEEIYDVKIAKDGQDARDKLHFESTSSGLRPFDILFVNMMMPIMDDGKLTPHLRTLAWEIPIIGLTTSFYHREYRIKANVNDFLVQPFRRNALRNVIRKHCPGVYPKVIQSSAAGF